MYWALIRGKLPTEVLRSEDVITACVFGFLNYSDRSVYLAPLLSRLDVQVTEEGLRTASFEPWPTYSDGTEPDVVLRVDDWYILFEAKLRASFGHATLSADPQLDREAREGARTAALERRRFRFVVITPDLRIEPATRERGPSDRRPHIRWIRWGDVAAIVTSALRSHNSPPSRLLAEDLLRVLDRADLRHFVGFESLRSLTVAPPTPRIFFASDRLRFRGFARLLDRGDVGPISGPLFWRQNDR